MGVFKSYQIKNNDLYLTEHMFWTFEPNNENAVRVWHLTNFDKAHLDKSELDTLIDYYEDSELEQEQIGDKIRVSIFTYHDHSDFCFTCDSISSIIRSYNTDELTEIIIQNKKYAESQDKVITKYHALIDELAKHLDKEIDRKNRVIDQVVDKANHTVIKSKHQLEILVQIKNIISWRKS